MQFSHNHVPCPPASRPVLETMQQRKIQYMPRLIGDLLDIISNAILVIDSRERIIFANSHARTMFRAGDKGLGSMAVTDIFMPGDQEVFARNFLAEIRRQQEFETEAMLRRLDGTSFLGLLSGTLFYWDNRQEGMALAIHDITHVKSLERSLRRSKRVAFLGRLVDDISHQIRNPVQVIGGFARRLEHRCEERDKVRVIVREAERLELLLDTLHHFIRLPRPRPEMMELVRLVRAAEEHLQPRVTGRGCSWVADYDLRQLDGRALLVDLPLLLEALEAVVDNACESYRQGEEPQPVVFRVGWHEYRELPCTMGVRDQGCGISEEQLQHVFSHFFSNKTRHIGLGLTLAERILAEQQGRVTIASRPGQGTEVVFHLGRERRRLIRTTRLS